MSNIWALGLAVLVGVLTTLQSAINTELGKQVGGIGSALISFLVGSLTLGIFYLVARDGGLREITKASPYLMVGGFFGALIVFGIIKLIPVIGTGSTMAGIIAGQLILAMVVDQFGWFGMEKIGLNWTRGIGAVLLLIGTKLMVK